MAKYRNKKKKSTGMTILIVVLSVLLAALLWLASVLHQWEIPTLKPTEQPTETTEATQEATQEATGEQEQESEPESTEPQMIDLYDGLTIHHIGSYAGMYMEDGTNEPVSDVMMLILENTAAEDLQLARISIAYTDFTAEFELTNLPAGEKVVLLEQNRHPAPTGDYLSIETRNVLFFPETMSLQEDRIRIGGSNGMLELTNISDEDITGDIYIYYKNSARDLLYGGITYRVSVKGGLKAGESNRVVAGHYTPDNCRFVLVDCGD